jgi:hypothetical protein
VTATPNPSAAIKKKPKKKKNNHFHHITGTPVPVTLFPVKISIDISPIT